MMLERYRSDAVRRVQAFEKKYEGQENGIVPINIARRWALAFERQEVSLDEIVEILRDAEREKDLHGLKFHAFCNDMRAIYQSLCQDFLDRGAKGDEPPG